MKKILVAVMAVALMVGVKTGIVYAQQSAAPTPAFNPTAAPTPLAPLQQGGISGNGQGFVSTGNNPLLDGVWDSVNTRVRPSLGDTAGRQQSLTVFSADSSPAPSLFNNTALSTTVTNVKTSTGNLYGYQIFNPGNATCYLQFFNATAANVTLGATTPVYVLATPTVAAHDFASGGALANFSTAMSVAATTTATGSSACNAAQVVNLQYK